jgi:hypothetical protein
VQALTRSQILAALQRLNEHIAASERLHYYPEDRLPVRTRLLLEELLGESG